ncbi:hypothetical protein BHE90_001007 [Fusarium euwallaceae]|uniref:AAA+ ATPase domain-containing protein n=1 Tax=Fusarium euwallaceae TaxID=1147111 RepID=A0A430M8S3_9HYPO|nr:hypothetical protein BHE90_001007 [Fusarium euwallaceae]
MATTTETSSSVSDLLEKITAIERKLAELDLKQKGTLLTEAALALKDEANKLEKPNEGGKAKSEKEHKEEQEEGLDPRVKIVINRTDPETGEPIEEDSKLRKAKDKDQDAEKYAFILRKCIYETKYSPFPADNNSEIDITNPELWNLLKENLAHHPYHIFRDSPVTLNSPYEAIVFHWDELRAEANKVVEDEVKKRARADLGLLLDTISGGSSGDERLDKYFKMRPNYTKQQPGTVQFEDLWTVFRPGMLVYGHPFQNEDQVLIVKDNSRAWPWQNHTRRGGNEFAPWELDAWSYDWKDGSFRRTEFTLTFEYFDGHLPLTSLPFYPFDLHPKHDAVRRQLIKRGKQFRSICESKEGSRLFEYSGQSILEKKGFSGMRSDEETSSDFDLASGSSFPFPGFNYFDPYARPQPDTVTVVKSSEVQSRVMVDYESYFQYGGADGRNGPLKSSGVGVGCACSDCTANKGLAARYRTHFDDPEVANKKEWEDEQYLICPPRVLGYILQEKQWAQLQVTSLKRPADEGNESAWFSRLKLADDIEDSRRKRGGKEGDNSTKKLLLDLVSSHSSTTLDNDDDDEEKLEVNDIIPGKGKGLIILLYGPPGVGKTSTAETIAIATRKPLFSVSVADVGTKAKHVESNLSRIFSLATKWQAILLIDEADVFLESRGRGNAIQSTDKNALVSVFLRVLEYYQGIMFLTTNQIAQFDVAIPSRIHIAIRYESLKEDQMEAIFSSFLGKLDEKGLIEDYREIKDWLEDVVYKECFDGRQIRNLVTTALGLARAAAKDNNGPNKLTKKHLKRAFTNACAFKRDFNTQMQRYKDSQNKMIK